MALSRSAFHVFKLDSKRCKGVYYVDLGESFHMSISIYLQNLASIQPRTDRLKFGGMGYGPPPPACPTLGRWSVPERPRLPELPAATAARSGIDRANLAGLVLGCIEAKFYK